MGKARESISIDSNVNDLIKSQAKKENRNYSNMIECMAKKYLNDIKKK